ncbi:hypothetical protein [Microbacterium sediminis]|uniref:Uncharacterized protein n=1 Tax=Microbacterium sediminis TaxID=904291 RepID=A0A1B9NA51_9MICO|nr:hypothetical protein [Microbacterium sediminis]OCG73479.1 hypothetical protein A7J15_07255 [Microbacterium sediminis]
MTVALRRAARASWALTATLLLLALAACSKPGGGVSQYGDRLENELPAALLGSDLGITEADASRSQTNDRDKYFPTYPWADIVALTQE